MPPFSPNSICQRNINKGVVEFTVNTIRKTYGQSRFVSKIKTSRTAVKANDTKYRLFVISIAIIDFLSLLGFKIEGETRTQTKQLSHPCIYKKLVTNSSVCSRQLWRVETERGIHKLGGNMTKTLLQECSKEQATTFIFDDG